jgi:large subunit ribosomal protein L21
MIGGDKNFVGAPTLVNAKVTVVVTKQAKTRKVFVFKKKRRNGYRKFKTHRQEFTELFVKAITSPDGKTETTELEANVVDMSAKRDSQLQAKKEAKLARLSKTESPEEKAQAKTKPAQKAKTAKKPAKKAAPKKKAVGKKAGAKTTKKASKK